MLAASLATLLIVAGAAPGAAPEADDIEAPILRALWPGFVDEIDVRGARPVREVKAALRMITPALAGCVKARSIEPALMVLEVDLLAAGFADRLTVLLHEDVAGAIDEPCVRTTMRALPLRDRGLEPVSRMVLRFATTPGGVEKPAGLAPVVVGHALAQRREEIARCVVEERQNKPALAGTVLVRWTVRADGGVVDVEAHEGTLESMDARVCIAHEIARLRFADARAVPERVAWPLTFDPPRAERARPSTRREWGAPTLFQFLGCMP